MRTCKYCDLEKEDSEFRTKAKYHKGVCNSCQSERTLRCKDRDLRYTYGIGLADYEALLVRQNGKCAICRQKFSSKPHIDHDHSTGKVRGLLCKFCNVGIGMLKDDVEVLVNAISYLKSAPGIQLTESNQAI